MMLQQLQEKIEDHELNKNYVIPILNNNQLQLSLVNDMLDYAQMNNKKFKYTFRRFDLKKLIQECMNLFQIQCERKEITLSLSYPESSVKTEIVSDSNRIRQIIINLLGNAVKFTIKGGITIIVEKKWMFNKIYSQKDLIKDPRQSFQRKLNTVKDINRLQNRLQKETEKDKYLNNPKFCNFPQTNKLAPHVINFNDSGDQGKGQLQPLE